ncbi:MAG: hypothetical protein HUU01_12555 [Saprospiraceae bacterium]|nr:hypothetical protein [Saprospiraceae bacterium]
MQPPESSHADEIRQAMQKMLDDNAKAAAEVVTVAQKTRDEAAAALESARQDLLETTQNEATLYAAFFRGHWDRIEKDLHERINRDLAAKLLHTGQPLNEIADLLRMPEAEVLEMAMRFGHIEPRTKKFLFLEPKVKWHKMNTSYARVTYEDQGRGGYVVFQMDSTICRFWYEFGSGSTLVFIDVPAEAQWESHTKIPLADRDEVLNFIGRRAIADKAPGYRYRIEATSVVIYNS